MKVLQIDKIFFIFNFYFTSLGKVSLLGFIRCRDLLTFFSCDSFLKNELTLLPFSSSSWGHRVLDKYWCLVLPKYFPHVFLSGFWRDWGGGWVWSIVFGFLRRAIFCFQIFHFQLTNDISSSIFFTHKPV